MTRARPARLREPTARVFACLVACAMALLVSGCGKYGRPERNDDAGTSSRVDAAPAAERATVLLHEALDAGDTRAQPGGASLEEPKEDTDSKRKKVAQP